MQDAVKAVNNLQCKQREDSNSRKKLNSVQIKALLARGKTYTTPDLTFKYKASTQPATRLAIVVSKKTLPLAVARNYFKRIQRVHCTRHRHTIGAVDIVVIANKSLYNSKLTELNLTSTKAWFKFLKSLKATSANS